MKKAKIKPVAPVVTLYKVLTADGHSPYITAYAWSLPIDNGDGTWTPGAWHEEPARVLDEGRGLHVTPSPSTYWPRRDCIAYECEASGYRENPESDRHIVATRVRLLRPIGRDAATDISRKWGAEQNARYVKQRQKERLGRAREAAAAKKANIEAGRKAGVACDARVLDARRAHAARRLVARRELVSTRHVRIHREAHEVRSRRRGGDLQ